MAIGYGVLSDAKQELAIGFWIEVDGKTEWDLPDPPDVLRVGTWIAANEHTFKKSYRTTRRDCGFAIVFDSWQDADKMYEWLLEPGPVPDGPDVTARVHRRRNKYQQLPGTGDRKWSARLNKSLVKSLRVPASTPFSRSQSGVLFVPVTLLRAFSLNW